MYTNIAMEIISVFFSSFLTGVIYSFFSLIFHSNINDFTVYAQRVHLCVALIYVRMLLLLLLLLFPFILFLNAINVCYVFVPFVFDYFNRQRSESNCWCYFTACAACNQIL